jgi:hypothetical protein
MADTSELQFERHLLGKLLIPSYLSGSVAVLSTLTLLGSVLLTKLYWSHGWLADTLQTVGKSNSHLLQHDTGDGSSSVNMALLFLFWGCVGLAVYFLVIGLSRAAKEAKELEEEISFVHGNRKVLLKSFAQKFAARLGGLVLTFITIALYTKIVLPYGLQTVRAAQPDIHGVLFSLVAALLMLLTVHLLAVFLRAVFLRPRLFSTEIEV